MNITPERTKTPQSPWRVPLAAVSIRSLANILQEAGFPGYRADQIMNWFYKKSVRDFADMNNLPAPLKAWLSENYTPMSSHLMAAHDAGDGAVKLEIALADSETVEAVLMESPPRATLCLSCQAGCPLCCTFCATGQAGFARNLYCHEIVEQALHAVALLSHSARISRIVFMGMGEPALNLDAVFDAVRTLNSDYAFGIGARKITISTLGDPRTIARIAAFPLEVALAISLHAADNTLRAKLIPSAPASAAETVAAAWDYFQKTHREVTYEYVLLAGVNDSTAHARRLADLLAGKRAFVNIIPYNETDQIEYKRPSRRKIAGFERSLASRGIKVHTRDSLGQGAKAACGQLRLT